jgi:hypothetical protein
MPLRDPLLKLLLLWVTLLTTVLWLPIVRGLLNGEEYEWAIGPFGGNGTGGDYWKLLVAMVYVMVLLLAGRRGPRPLFPVLLLPLMLAFNAAIIYAAWTNPDALRFQGDTLGVDISLAWILPIVFTLFTALAIWWTIDRAAKRRFLHRDPQWVRRNRVLLLLAAAMLPVQFVAFRYGGETGNEIGVFVTIIQWFVFNIGLSAPTIRPPRPANPDPFPPP